MGDLTGRTIGINGMKIEIVSDDGERLECRNLTTGEAVVLKRAVVEQAIKLGMADVEQMSDNDGGGRWRSALTTPLRGMCGAGR